VKVSRAFKVCIAIGLLHLALLAWVGLMRLAYPFDVEWMEGGQLTHAVRLAQGQPIYARPNSEFTAFFYTPLYSGVVSLLAGKPEAVTHALGRAVSLASTLATVIMLALVVRREAGARYSLLAVGTYAALDRFSGTFTSVARADALALALALFAAILARYGRRSTSAIAAAVVAVLSVFTKQTMVILGVGIGAWLLFTNRRRGLLFVSVAGVLGVAASLWLERSTSGWFSFYVVSGHQSHAFFWANLGFYFFRDVLFLAPILLLLPLAWARAAFPSSQIVTLLFVHLTIAFAQRALTLDYPPHMYFRELAYESPRWLLLVVPTVIAVLVFRRRPHLATTPARASFWAWMFGAAMLASAVGHATQWAYKNAFMPLALFGSLFVALSLQQLGPRTPILAALAFQLLVLFDAPASRLPSSTDHARVRALRERLSRIDGPVLVLAHPLFAFERDRAVHVHHMGLQDVAALGGVDDLKRRASAHAWGAVVVDEGDGIDVPAPIREHYRQAERLDGPWMKTGIRCRPAYLWLPR